MVQVMVVEQQEGQGPRSRAKFRVESRRRSVRPNNARSSVLNKVGRITFFVSQKLSLLIVRTTTLLYENHRSFGFCHIQRDNQMLSCDGYNTKWRAQSTVPVVFVP